MKNMEGQQLIDRYKFNYGIPQRLDLSEDSVWQHWRLEQELARQLLASTPEQRWETFDRSYTRLYSELPWLNASEQNQTPAAQRFANWTWLIGNPPKKVYEIGSGKGELIEYLASRGYECCATEITRERGAKHTASDHNLRWRISDGIHVDQFESNDTYDVVISDQVIEHMHPDDVLQHFRSVNTILASGGKYIFATPHKYFGPSDVSQVFACDEPKGMHLKEYLYGELCPVIKQAGFQQIFAVWRMPARVSLQLGFEIHPRISGAYLGYLHTIERLLSRVPRHSSRRKIASLLRLAFFPMDILLVATK